MNVVLLSLIMPIRKKLTVVVLMIVLHQPVAAAISTLPLGKASAALASIERPAWAEGENPVSSDTPTAQGQPQASPEKQPEPVKISPPPLPVLPVLPIRGGTFIDVWQREISRELLDSAEWLDSFFEDPRFLKEDNRSYIRARVDVFNEQWSGTTFKQAFSVRVRLPQLERKLHIVFSSEPAPAAVNAPGPASTVTDRAEALRSKDLTGAVHYIFKSTAEESAILRTGAQISLGKPVLFVAPRYRVFFPFNPWSFRVTQEATYRTDTKWEMDSQFDLERPFPHDLFYRTSLAGVWTEGVVGYLYSLSFSLRQAINPTHALDYEWINSFQTRPSGELTEFAFVVRYRHSFLRNWLFYEVAPQYRFPRDKSYHATPGILFRLELFFGVVQ